MPLFSLSSEFCWPIVTDVEIVEVHCLCRDSAKSMRLFLFDGILVDHCFSCHWQCDRGFS